MKKRISFPQLATGAILGFFIVLGIIVGAGYLYFLQLSKAPPKPKFPEISEAEKEQAKSLASIPSGSAGTPDDSYVALVVFPDGLLMRAEPDQNSDVILTLEFEETVRVLGQSPNGQWEEVLLETTGSRGWVSKGNTRRVN